MCVIINYIIDNDLLDTIEDRDILEIQMPSGPPSARREKNKKRRQSNPLTAFLIASKIFLSSIPTLLIKRFVSINNLLLAIPGIEVFAHC